MLSYKIVYPDNPSYPKNLKQVPNFPKKLYISGEVIDQDTKAIAVIGSRKMSDYGKKVAWEFSYTLAKKGITIVSGMARGIDTVAHKAAIFAEGRTLAVLGSGIDVIYPSENSFLAGTISSQGAVITEFSPGTPPYAKNFLSRNRIISGLSIATLVVEGAARSGTLSISNWALNQGRDVFAIPGRIDSPLSALPNYLIENGAIPVTNPEDILDIIK
jgi:DNA processing protein